jgi:hypothetical protein
MRRAWLFLALASVGVAQAPETPTTTIIGAGWRVEVFGPKVEIRQDGDAWLVQVRP